VQDRVYAGGWPARLLDGSPLQPRVQVVHHRLPILPARAGRQRLRLGFASDLHLGPLTPQSLLEEAFAHLAEAALDVLVLGGDYVSLAVNDGVAARLSALVASVPAPLKAAVLGNHDLWTQHPVIEAALVRGGARVLVNESLRLASPHDDVVLVGLDDVWCGDADPVRAFAATEGAALKLVVGHAPESLPLVAGRGASLLVCGHTHGGQVATPWGPILKHGRESDRYPSGLHQVDDLYLFVSRGLGFSDLPVRIFAPPDVAVLDLVRPNDR
jgi:predicted MPP superfamily phosphohydrolase